MAANFENFRSENFGEGFKPGMCREKVSAATLAMSHRWTDAPVIKRDVSLLKEQGLPRISGNATPGFSL